MLEYEKYTKATSEAEKISEIFNILSQNQPYSDYSPLLALIFLGKGNYFTLGDKTLNALWPRL